MNKEVLDQTMDIQILDSENKWDYIGIFDMFDDGAYLWFTSIEYNALFKLNKCTFHVNYMGSFPNEELYGVRLYTSINEYNGKLFFTPCTAHEIGVYDIEKKCFEKINIGISRKDNDLSKIKNAKKFASSFFYKDSLILLPCCYDRVVVCHISTGKVSFRNSLFEYFYAKYGNYTTSSDGQFYLCWFAKRISETNIVFNLHCNRNILIFYDLATGEFSEQVIGNEKRSFSLIEYDMEQVYLYDINDDMLIKWDIETNEYFECHIADKLPEFQPCGLAYSFSNMVVLGDWLYLIPASTNVAVKINTATLDAVAVDALSDECSAQNKGIAYLNLCRIFDNKLYLWGNQSRELIIYGKDGNLQRIKIKVEEDMENILAENHLADIMQNNLCWVSEEQIPLTRFINVLEKIETEQYIGNRETAVKNCGDSIYQFTLMNDIDS